MRKVAQGAFFVLHSGASLKITTQPSCDMFIIVCFLSFCASSYGLGCKAAFRTNVTDKPNYSIRTVFVEKPLESQGAC